MAINNTKPYPFFVGMPPGSPTAMTWIDPTTVPAGPGPFSSVLYVDNVRGSDTTGQRGNASLPFRTPQAAINAMQTGDVVQLAAQQFTIAATLTIPAAVVRGAFLGYAAEQFPVLTSSTVEPRSRVLSTTVDVFDLGANLGLAEWIIGDVQLIVTAAGKSCILADGSAYAAGAFLSTGGLILRNAFLRAITLSMVLKYVGILNAYDTVSTPGGITATTCFQLQFNGCELAGGNITVTCDTTDPLCPQGVFRGALIFNQATRGGLASFGHLVTIGGQLALSCDETSSMGALKGAGLVMNGAVAPSVSCSGWVGAVDFASAGAELPDTATALTWDMRGTRFYQGAGAAGGVVGAAVVAFKVGGAGANAQAVKLDGALTLPGCAVTADVNITMTCRGASMPQATFATPGATGTIVPPNPFVPAATAVAAAPQAIAFGFRAGTTSFAVAYTTDNAGSVPTGVITAKAATGFSAGLVAAGGGNVDAVINFR